MPVKQFLRFFANIILIAALPSCVTYTIPHDGISRAAFGETIAVEGPLVTPRELLEDSRCPHDVQCVWKGRVRIMAQIDLGTRTEMLELTEGVPVQIADGALEMVEVSPEKTANWQIFTENYRFGFTFAGGY